MPTKTVRFQNKQGDWKSTSKEYNKYAKYLPKGRRGKVKFVSRSTPPLPSKRKAKPFTETKITKIGNDKDLIVDKTAGYTDRKERLHSTVVVTEAGTKIQLTEQEDAGKYTPKRTITNVEYLESANVLQVGKINPRVTEKITEKKEALKNEYLTQKQKDILKNDIKELEEKEIVSSTQVKLDNAQAFFLVNDFKTWDTIKDPKEKTKSKRQGGTRLNIAELRILAQDLDVPTSGITQPTLEQRLRKKLQKQEPELKGNTLY